MGNFIEYIPMIPDWKQIAWDVNCTDKYRHDQDLSAVFHNATSYIISKADSFKNRYGYLPSKELRGLCYEFRRSFPTTGRRQGLRYFDDDIEDFIANYSLTEYWLNWLNKNKPGVMIIASLISIVLWVLFKIKLNP